MAKISESVIEEIKARISISDVVSRYLTLQRKGDRYWGLCPFHDEKTPSFSVLPEKGFFHCFGCGKSGSLFDFIMEMEHLNFPESVRYLAQEAGIQIEEENEDERRKRTEVETLRDLYNKLASSFNYILSNSVAAEHARSYLVKRGFNTSCTETFLLGFAPDDPDWLFSFLREKQYSPEILAKSGLFARNNPQYPLFRNRLMFPIRDWQGRVVAFGGRDLSGTSQAKYINTPETVLYRKREIVYGLYESLSEVKKQNQSIMCEGYFDVMALHQAGLKTAMAPLGTAFTLDQGKLIRRYAEKVLFLFDGDVAGLNATKKALVTVESLGFEAQVILFDEANDPAELLEKKGSQALSKACQTSKSAFDYLVHSAINMYDSKKATGKLQIFNEMKPYLDAVESEIVRQSYLRDLAGYLQLDEATLMHDYVNRSFDKSTRNREEKVPRETESKPILKGWKQSTDLYAMLTVMNNRALFSSVRNRLPIDALVDEYAIELYTILEDASREEVGTSDEYILQKIKNEHLRQIVALSFQTDEFTAQPEQVLEESIRRITLRRLEKVRKSVENLIRLADRDGSVSVELSHLLLEKKSLDEEIANMRKPEHV
ncbi:MAG: DNA primase [Sphaerochaetaceae bacterium]|jgi:DNA primase|nr:DNA primase [Sphaerochaetaceae bacterium]MDD3366580.1 DNA primase [Sphaerochaetaceae bacterium]MDD4218944.1 DNA primase [Sphaerochaetaceae bacterium]MDY0372217.1 DNA primase [Sphaerochaetaceae bacterium]